MIMDLPYHHTECTAVFYQEAAYVEGAGFFETAFSHILEVEGEEFNPQKASRYGLRASEMTRLMGSRHKFNSAKVQKLTKAEARKIYQDYVWQGLHLNRIQSKAIAIALFDQVVDRGSLGAITFLQSYVNSYTNNEAITVNGVLTEQTISILNTLDEKVFIPSYVVAMQHSYMRIARKNPDKRRFLENWIDRTNAILRRASESPPEPGL